ncbi:MAG: DUF4988 and DUF4465 domain-containing protein [Paramuribaculum sp.]|nr:DUF4988 and DUF4465 domain-containing protein [Paramuribaculum sp.]MDE6460497.1 DUF4988 and DUF4465 domain-containing protein [Paramuribaculum sp.]
MRKSIIILSLAAALFIPSACSYDDSDLWNAVNGIEDRVETLETASAQMNTDIKSLQSILQAIQNNISITAITPTENGYTIKFSNGTEATISNGIDGASAPEISVRKDDDGLYYWTIAGEWLIVDGEKVRATALDGADAVAPQMRINPETGIWEISTDGGKVWTSTGVAANGDKGDSLFSKVDVSNSEYVEFTLADGSTFRVQRYNSSAPLFSVEDAEGLQIIRCGESKSFKVETANVASFSISKPDGWRASFADNTLTITAPVEANQYAEQEGVVDITVVSTAGTSMIVRIQVATFERRVLTFEDADVKFKPFTLEYCNKNITNWSDLIDSKQYGGPMLYGDSGYGMDQPYEWYDEGNTELKHTMVEGYGMFCYWNGGHAISNYVSTNLAEGDFSHQLAVYGTSGHNGSANFAVHDGYRDESAYKKDATLPSIEFGDGKEHVVESMWVMNTLYAMNCYLNGNGLTAEIGPDDWVKLVATGYNLKGDKVGETTFYTCNGPDNIVNDWTKWDLSVLGKVAKIEFNVTGSSDNGSGFSQPAYFAYDDVTVQI